MNTSFKEPEPTVETDSNDSKEFSDQWFNDQFENLLPKIQERWPAIAKQTLEATKGSLDELIKAISIHSGSNDYGVQEQLEDLFENATDKTKKIAHSLEPLEKQLETLLDELNDSLRPRIEKPVRKRPLLSLGIAAGVGVLLGIILSGGRRS